MACLWPRKKKISKEPKFYIFSSFHKADVLHKVQTWNAKGINAFLFYREPGTFNTAPFPRRNYFKYLANLNANAIIQWKETKAPLTKSWLLVWDTKYKRWALNIMWCQEKKKKSNKKKDYIKSMNQWDTQRLTRAPNVQIIKKTKQNKTHSHWKHGCCGMPVMQDSWRVLGPIYSLELCAVFVSFLLSLICLPRRSKEQLLLGLTSVHLYCLALTLSFFLGTCRIVISKHLTLSRSGSKKDNCLHVSVIPAVVRCGFVTSCHPNDLKFLLNGLTVYKRYQQKMDTLEGLL